MPHDYRRLQKHHTNKWFLNNRIVIKTAYRSIGNQIKERCKATGIMFYYGGHCVGSIEYAGRIRAEYKTEILEKSLKVKELIKWAFAYFNSRSKEDVWIETRPNMAAMGSAGWWKGKDTDLPPETNTEIIDGKPMLKVEAQSDMIVNKKQ